MTFDVFISYNSSDSMWASRLKSRLELRGLKVWLDRDQIRPGDLFVTAIEEGLDNSRTIVLLCSKEALQSKWVLNEYNRAIVRMNERESHRRVIPVLLDKTPLPGFLTTLQWVDFTDQETLEDNLNKLFYGISGDWPDISHGVPTASTALNEIMLSARKSLTVWGHTLDKFAHDAKVKNALVTLFHRQTTVKLILLNPHCPYAHAHEPFHLLESRGSAQHQLIDTIRFLNSLTKPFDHPKVFHAFLTNYMPRFRTILVDEKTLYISLYLYGEDVGRAPEFKLIKGAAGETHIWFETIVNSLNKMLLSPFLIPLVQSGHFNKYWSNCQVASILDNCLSTSCCTSEGNCWNRIRNVILGYQNEMDYALSLGLIGSDYEAGTFTIGSVAANSPFMFPAVGFDTWVKQVLNDNIDLLCKADPNLLQIQSREHVIEKVIKALNFKAHSRLKANPSALKHEIWYQEYSDILQRLLLTFLSGDPDRQIDLYPDLTNKRQGFMFKVIKFLEENYTPDLKTWLRLSISAGLLGVNEKPSHAATSEIIENSGIPLSLPNEPPQRSVERVAKSLMDLAETNSCINATEVFLLGIRVKHGEYNLVAFPDDYLETIILLRYYQELLSQFSNLKIHLVPRSIRCSNDASFDDVQGFLLNFPELRDNPRFEVVPNGPKLGGVNLQKLHGDITTLLFQKCTAVDVRGARNYEMMQGINKETYFGFMVCRDFSEAVTGLRAEEHPLVYLRHLPGDRSFIGFRERHLRVVEGKRLAAVTVADQKARWEGGHMAHFHNWTICRQEAFQHVYSYYVEQAGGFHERFGDTLEPEVTSMLDQFKGQVTVVGCGSGKEVAYLCNRGCDAHGIDFSPEAIILAQNNHRSLQHRFAVQDLYDLDLCHPESTSDGIVANAVLVHLLERKDLSTVLAKFYRHLRKGGICFLRLLNKEVSTRQELDDGRWFVYFDQEEVQNAAKEVGFDVVTCPAPRSHTKYPKVQWITAMLKRP